MRAICQHTAGIVTSATRSYKQTLLIVLSKRTRRYTFSFDFDDHTVKVTMHYKQTCCDNNNIRETIYFKKTNIKTPSKSFLQVIKKITTGNKENRQKKWHLDRCSLQLKRKEKLNLVHPNHRCVKRK
jgi:hypothetical protein